MSTRTTPLLPSARQRGPFMDYGEAKRRAAAPDPAVRRALARRDDVQPEILYFLAEDPEAEIRREIAANRATPVQADLLLSHDADDDVRVRVARKIAQIAPELTPAEQDRIGRWVVDILETLARDQLVRVRAILAEALKESGKVPPGVVERLARDGEIAVAGPVLSHSPLLADDILLEIIESRPVRGAVAAIARRRIVAPTVADAIAASADESAITALLANPSAQIRERTLDVLVETAERVPSWHAPLVARPRLSADSVRRLAGFVAESLLAALQRRADIDPETAGELTRIVAERAARAGSGPPGLPDDEEEEDRAARWHAEGRLDEAAISEALDRGERAFVIAALALRAGLRRGAVQKIVSLRSAKGIVALAWKAGLDAALALRLQLRLARIAPGEALRPGRDAWPLAADDMAWQLEFFAG